MSKLFVTGHKGMVGSAVCRYNTSHELITADKNKLDLRSQDSVDLFIKDTRPDKIVICSAKVGGIHANNTYPAEFMYDNLMIQTNIINSAYKHGVHKLLFLGSSCIYPKFAPQPIIEESLLSAPLEPTNESYALAKIAGLKMCEFYRKQYGVEYTSIMPTNLYGINDNYHPENSHVIPGLLGRFHQAKIDNSPQVTMWGTGSPKREFLYVDDLAKIIHQLLYMSNLPAWVNVGSPHEYTIYETACKIKEVVNYKGEIVLDSSKPDGTPRKKLDLTLLESLVLSDYTDFYVGLQSAYADFLNRHGN